MEKQRISIIMPVYNSEKYLRDSISDILSQTYPNLEIILVDDASTDNSLDILKKYAERDDRIKIIETIKNAGVSHARNLGLDVASGEFIRFVDADDRLPIDSIERLITPYQEDQTIDIVIGNYTTNPNNNYMTGDLIKEGKVGQKDFIHLFLSYVRSFYFGVPWNKLYRREIIEKNHLRFDDSLLWCEDFIFNIGYFRNCEQFYLLVTDKGVYEYCKREGSITENLCSDKRINFERIDRLRYEVMRDFCKQEGLEENFRLEWKYSELFGKLSAVVKKNKECIKINQRYQKFKCLLQGEDVYRYICYKEQETHLMVWKLLKYAKKKEKYFLSFIFFYVKGCVAVYGKTYLPFLHRIFQVNSSKKL